MDYIELQQKSAIKKRIQNIKGLEDEKCSSATATLHHGANINSQGIIHLNHEACNTISTEFMNVLREQNEQNFGFERIKRMQLEHILILIKRVQLQQFNKVSPNLTWKDTTIDSVLSDIEADITRAFDFSKIALENQITQSYFRMIFKEITGLSPLDYVNRLRILRAMELLQTKNISIANVATQVGIFDSNYFSRLFKKIIGYPPSYFKNIGSSGKQE